MKILVIHPFNLAGFKTQLDWLANNNHDIRLIKRSEGPAYMGVRSYTLGYERKDASARKVHPYASQFENQVSAGEAVAKFAIKLRDEEQWTPDLIWGMPAWGDLLFIKDVYPDTPVLSFVEFCWSETSLIKTWDAEETDSSLDTFAKYRTHKAGHLLSVLDAEVPYVATEWAKSTFPEELQDRIKILHEGISTVYFSRKERDSALECLQAVDPSIPSGKKLVTYLARGYERSRGFHSFMRALPELLKQNPNAHVVCMGSDNVYYGAAAPDGKSCREAMLDELGPQLDQTRIHWLPYGSREQVKSLYSVSDCHVYLTAPLQISLSPLEAMSCEAPVVSNDVPGMREVIDHGVTGWLTDFFDYTAIAEQCTYVLKHPKVAQKVGTSGRAFVQERFGVKPVMEQWIETFKTAALLA
jgi:glycosyltransferase involved in cell wall biosynthesis